MILNLQYGIYLQRGCPSHVEFTSAKQHCSGSTDPLGSEAGAENEKDVAQGRVRSFPHEKNNWASFVYIDVSDLDLDDVRNFLVKVILCMNYRSRGNKIS